MSPRIVQRFRQFSYLALALFSVACSTGIPDPHYERHEFPADAYVGDVKDRPYDSLGIVRGRAEYVTLDPGHEEGDLCRNYYNKAVRDLVKAAREKKADAVIQVKSVVFYDDGRSTTYSTPECSDDGEGGQVLVQGIAVAWKKPVPLRKSADEFPVVDPADQNPVIGKSTAKTPAVSPNTPSNTMDASGLLNPLPDKYRGLQLKKVQDGLDGGIRIVPKPTRVVLFTNDRKILDEQNIEEKRSWLGFEFLTSTTQRNILLSRDQDGEVSAEVLDLRGSKLEVVGATDTQSKIAEPFELKSGPHSAWKLVPGTVHDILQVLSQPDSKMVSYIRYHNSNGVWYRTVRAEQGVWDALSTPFPGDDKFPL
jgi:hypothetical protein